jgi:hypothetical protein
LRLKEAVCAAEVYKAGVCWKRMMESKEGTVIQKKGEQRGSNNSHFADYLNKMKVLPLQAVPAPRQRQRDESVRNL